ncbi:PTS system, beta-glucoside-specific IIA component [Enterococcus sp. AZ194]|uniref:beta-glucoside-specific PTS transporter subunit IIABC n=1 Tax=Enterococcus sp. AZ194 TaxID=2774629 RepID=UPI003F23C6C7
MKKEAIKVILANVGGEKNIKSFSHCFTRLRLDLKDNNKINLEKIEALDPVKGVGINGGQLQIIFGNEVEDYFNELENEIGTKEEVNAEKHTNVLDIFQRIFTPVFPALAAGGLLKGLLLAAQFSGLVDTSGPTFSLMMTFSDIPFYFLPIILAFSAGKTFKCNQYLAVLIAGAMLHPNFTSLTENASFLGLPVQAVNYSSTVFPILLSIFVLSYIEKGLRKIIPKTLALLFVPLFALIITAPIALIVIGPFANQLGLWIGDAVSFIYEKGGFIGGAIFGGIYPFLVFTGMHQAIPPIQLQNLAQTGTDVLLALAACGNAAIAGATLMIAIKEKDKNAKSLAYSTSLSGFIGITEPALYGVIAKYKHAFIATFIGGALGSAIVAMFKVAAVGMGPVPLAGIALFFGNKFIYYIVGILVATVGAMIAMNFLGVKTTEAEDEEEVKEFLPEVTDETIASPVKGKVMPLKDIKDPTFSSGVMGNGVGILPAEGKVYAPFDGMIEAVFPTNHALGIKSNDGIEMMIHIGIDTVKLKGQNFTAHVKNGENVKKGDLLIEFDKEAISKAGYDITTAVIVTNLNVITSHSGDEIDRLEGLFSVETSQSLSTAPTTA